MKRPDGAHGRWTSFVASSDAGRKVRGLHEEGNPAHRVRVEHDRHTLLIHLSDEDGRGWTCIAIDRASRESAVMQGETQKAATTSAWGQLYDS